jgi:hypothetical protein
MKKMLLALMLVLAMAFPAMAGDPIQTATATAVAVPIFNDVGNLSWGNASNGGWGVGAVGQIEVKSYAQGTKSADATAYAEGTAFGKGFAAGIETPGFGFGASGAISGVTLLGGGMGLGIDKFNWTKNPDYASVGIKYSGEVGQGNGIGVSNGAGTFAGGQNQTGATFGGGSFNESNGKVFGIDVLFPALAIGIDGAGALAGGYTVAGYVDTPNFAAAFAKTVGFSGYCADFGTVYGSGLANHQAVVNNGGSFGLSYGLATFSYNGTGNLGYGTAQTSGWTKITNGANFSSVKSFSQSSAYATVK